MSLRLRLCFCLCLASAQLRAEDEVLSYLEPYRSIEISSIETGVISEIRVKEGDHVAPGDVLLLLDNEITESRLAIARINAEGAGKLMATQAEVDLQQQRHDQLERLVTSGTSNSAELARQKALLVQAKGNHIIAQEEQKSFKLEVKQIEAELKRRVLTSPIDGIVVDISKDIAESVSLASARPDDYLVRVVEIDRLKCIGHVPALFARGLKKGDSLSLRVEDGAPVVVRGAVEFVSPVIDPATATVRIQLVIDNTALTLRSGATVQILLTKPGN
ncbi:MAG: Multidrug efflux pump subunit AcrA (membrane-fusion protein) [Verrucomicrobia bacterium]|nr:MAG: Multidrug efflux pump subunit AcrA (membrane-fusion protein) [Verrucomicrobiota bacterium]